MPQLAQVTPLLSEAIFVSFPSNDKVYYTFGLPLCSSIAPSFMLVSLN
jgi:hypothetical protein